MALYDVDPADLRIYFSGHKGFHVVLPIELFVGEPEVIGITPGADSEFLKDGGEIEQTQSSLVLEDLIGKFLFNKATTPAAAPAEPAVPAAPAPF